MKKHLTCVMTFAALLLFPCAGVYAEDYIAVHAVYCSAEKDVAELADVSGSPNTLRALLARKINEGKCSPPSAVNKKATMLVRKLTQARQVPYYCFKEEADAEKGTSSENFCVLERFVATFKDYVAQRTGNYGVKRQVGNIYKIECVEGGTVTLEKRGGEFYRISDALQLTSTVPNPPLTPAGTDLDRAIRDGCKGVDYLFDLSAARK